MEFINNKFYKSGIHLPLFSSISRYFPSIKLEQTTIYSVLITSGQNEGDVTIQKIVSEGSRITVPIHSNNRVCWPKHTNVCS